ncbi:MAG: DUF1565 domain-containing protein, partial [Candidatus Thorarchaeota archaeon]
MESNLENKSRICPVPPRSRMGLNLGLRPKPIFMAVSLALILTMWIRIPLVIMAPPLISHDPITIDGNANFLNTALLEGWPGDGSPENPFIIDRLEIDLGGAHDRCISISNTRVSFIISNCNLTGAYYGISLENVTNAKLVNNTCSSNTIVGIELRDSYLNTIVNNICSNNNWVG